VAEKVLLAVSALESERARLAAQLSETLESERRLTTEVGELRVRVQAVHCLRAPRELGSCGEPRRRNNPMLT
jgi:hypothetical protein